MNRGIPKSARDALANMRPAEQHPSPDLLNGYVEQSLSATEKAGVTQHLAVCQDCREVVFLASAASLEPSAVAESPRAWRRWKWAVPAAAVLALALASGVLLERRELFAPRQAATQAANHKAAALPSQTAGSQATTESKALALRFSPAVETTPNPRGHVRATFTNHNETSAQDRVAAATAKAETPNEKQEAMAELTEPAPSGAPSSPTVVARNAAAASSVQTAEAAPLQTAEGQPTSAAPLGALGQSSFQSMKKAGAPSGISSAASQPSLPLRSQWRITDKGRLERSQVGGNWTQVLADQPIRFRAVAVVGNDVWAGGNNGALFHSVDAGEHWNQVTLGADGHTETGAVVSIHFDTVSQGSIRTETGSTWTTSDRGQSWNK